MNGSEITPGVGTPKTILIVDDTPENLRVLLELLKQQGYKVRAVPNGKLALQAAASEQPDLILLDIMMPEMDGYEVCRRLKQDDKLREIPVVFLSALDETLDKVRALQQPQPHPRLRLCAASDLACHSGRRTTMIQGRSRRRSCHRS